MRPARFAGLRLVLMPPIADRYQNMCLHGGSENSQKPRSRLPAGKGSRRSTFIFISSSLSPAVLRLIQPVFQRKPLNVIGGEEQHQIVFKKLAGVFWLWETGKNLADFSPKFGGKIICPCPPVAIQLREQRFHPPFRFLNRRQRGVTGVDFTMSLNTSGAAWISEAVEKV